MRKLTLPVGRKRSAVEIGEMPVHIPFDVGQGQFPQQPGKRLIEPGHNFPPRKIQHELIAPHGGLPSRHRQRPVRMCTVEIGIFADHFRLDPEANLQTKVVDLFQERLEAVRQLARIRCPIAEAAVIVIPMAEPAVVDDQHVYAQVFCLTRQIEQFRLVKVEIHGLPAVEQNRPFGKRSIMAEDVLTEKAMADMGQPVKALRAVCKQQFGCLKAFSRRQTPGEAVGVDARYDAHGSALIQFDICAVIAGIDRHDAIAGPCRLSGIRLADDHKGIVLMTGGAATGGDGLDTVEKRSLFKLPLQRVASMKMEQLPAPEGDIQTGRRCPVQPDHLIAAIADTHGPGDHVLGLEYTVKQLHFQSRSRVRECNAQRLALSAAVKGRREAAQRVFSGPDLMAEIAKICADLAALRFRFHRGKAEIGPV